MDENWKDIKNYEGMYQVSDLGRIRSLDREIINERGWTKVKGKIISLSTFKDGYKRVGLYKEGRRRNYMVHRIVALHFIEDMGDLHVDHINGDRTDNRLVNLDKVTPQENMRRAYIRNGPLAPPKLRYFTVEDIRRIRKEYVPRKHKPSLHKEYGVSRITIKNIATRKSWNHID
jgi:hypothetical protein